MRKNSCLLVSILSLTILAANVCLGQGRGGGSRSIGSGARSGGGMRSPAASSSRGSGGRPSTPNLGGSRPNVSRPNISQTPSRPNPGGQVSRPSVNRPSGGLTPSTRPSAPSGNVPRPNLPSLPSNRPGAGSSGVATRPGTRPDTSVPSLGNRPGIGSLPGTGTGPGLGTRPSLTDRPSVGNRPGMGDRPALADRPGTPTLRPGAGDRPNLANRPGINTQPGGVGRPSPGDVGDFLGISRPLQPGGGGIASTLPARPGIGDRPASLPGLGERPGVGTRPGLGDRPGISGRPGITGGPGLGDRPNLTDRGQWTRNPVINNRPAWANIDRSVNINVNNRWNNAFVNPGRAGWWGRPPARVAFWAGWGRGVRSGWGHFHWHNRWFTGPWWGNHRFPVGGWHFHFWNHNFPARYWWGVPTWARLTTWFAWSPPPTVWAQPVFYDYGPEGNVTYVNNIVYVGGEEVATANEFAATAMDLATVVPPKSDEEAAATEWLPLGTFAVSTNEKDVEPSQVVQLAVNKAGIISGTLYNVDTDQAQAVQGQVDKETQRVAFRLGESETLVAETGLYNLTQEEAPVLVHFGTERTENYLLVRLQYSDDDEDNAPNSSFPSNR